MHGTAGGKELLKLQGVIRLSHSCQPTYAEANIDDFVFLCEISPGNVLNVNHNWCTSISTVRGLVFQRTCIQFFESAAVGFLKTLEDNNGCQYFIESSMSVTDG